jgi:hypothetical protein
MNITINRSQNDTLFCVRLKQTVIYKKTQNRIMLFAFAGIALLVLGHNWYNDACFTAYTVGGAFFVGLAIMSYYETRMNRNVGFSANETLGNYQETNFATKIEITETALSYDTLKNHYRYNWRSFNMFKIYKKHIFLFRNNNYCNCFIIKRSELTKDEFAEFYEFLKKNMLEKGGFYAIRETGKQMKRHAKSVAEKTPTTIP